ncbi:MAG: ATP-binding cassette domain-containing protein [Betaproteobacteria bacterium]
MTACGDRGELLLIDNSFAVSKGEILGLAGSSGNGQKELMEALTGQRKILSGEISISGQAFHATRVQAKLFIALNQAWPIAKHWAHTWLVNVKS